MKKKTTLTKMHIAPSTVCYDAVAARDSNEVGLILVAVRKKNGYSLVAFSKLLYNYGVDVSDKGISKWEKGYTTPSIYQLVAICHALNIKEGPSYFTKTFQKPALLNAIGQKKVAEYEMDLIASRRYQPGTEEPAKIDCIMMPVSELPVSAGLGAFLEGEMFQQIQVPASSVPAGAEFGIYVSGDSNGGADDMGSIMIEENVVSSAGARNRLDAEGIRRAIREAGFMPRLRDQLYRFRE